MLKAGETFAGRYRVEREIARGGMGVVFACRHLHTQEEVAIKVLKPDLPEAELVRKKFRVEWSVWGRAPSEHIVRTLDAGVDAESGLYYSAMELLHGETVAERVSRVGPLHPAQVAQIVEQVGSGLDAAHQVQNERGEPEPIVHRDLSPNNIFLSTRADGSTRVKILDFGAAKQISDSTGVTRILVGTPRYMASEQLRGQAVSPRTDIWALGLIAYYCLAGRHYWRVGTALLDADPVALQTEILSTELVPPSERLLEQGVSGSVPAEFDAWFLRCVDRDPSKRFDAAGRAARALTQALAHAYPLTAPAPRSSDVPAGVANPMQLPTQLSAQMSAPGGAPSAATTSPPADAGRASEPGGTRPVAPEWALLAPKATGRATAAETGESASVAPLASERVVASQRVRPSQAFVRWGVAGLALVVALLSFLLLRDRALGPGAAQDDARPQPNAANAAPPAGEASHSDAPISAAPGKESPSPPDTAEPAAPPPVEPRPTGASEARPLSEPPAPQRASAAARSRKRAPSPPAPKEERPPVPKSLYDDVGPSP
jgi:eukaryotic-like serine/threonine-protein kinase